MRRPRVGLLLVPMLCAAGCGTQHATSHASDRSAQEVVTQAVAGTTAAGTARVSMVIQAGVAMPGTSQELRATGSGVVDFTDHDNDLRSHGTLGTTETRTIGGAVYNRLIPESKSSSPSARTWTEIAVAGPPDGVAPSLGLQALDPTRADQTLAGLTHLGSVRRVGTGQVRGASATQYRATEDISGVAQKRLQSVPACLRATVRTELQRIAQRPPIVDVWVDHNRVVQVRVSVRTAVANSSTSAGSAGPAASPSDVQPATLSVTVQFYDFGVPVHIDRPPASQVQVSLPTTTSRCPASRGPVSTGPITATPVPAP